jgi:hypothetical protein
MKVLRFIVYSLRFTVYSLLFIVYCLTLSGCIEEFEADIPAEETDLLVVEGTICSAKWNTFILSRTQSIKSSYTPQMVMGATVSVRGSDGSEYKVEDNEQLQKGVYTCWVDTLDPDVEYSLHIETDGEVYESEPQKPLRTEEIEDVRGAQYTPESDIDVLVTPAAPFESDKVNYYSWTCDETWEVHPEYTTIIFYDIASMMPVYNPNQFASRGWKDATSSTIMVGASSSYEGQHIRKLKIYDIAREDRRMYYRYSGLLHQRAISKAEYEYDLARRQVGSEMGGLFTPQPSSLPTNIRCLTSRKHVIGYVGCSLNTSEYRFFLDARDFSIPSPPQRESRLWVENPTGKDCWRLVVEEGMFLCIWEDEREIGGSLLTGWAYRYQLDVRSQGAYIEQPDFWIDGK